MSSETPAAPAVTVIIVNFNAGDRLRRCLDHLAAQRFSDFETVVIDNGSTDDSLATANASSHPFTLIEAGENLGFAAANNRAAKAARGAWLAILNPDAYAQPDWLTQLMAATARYPQADAFGSLQLDAASPDCIDGAGDAASIYGIAYRHGFGAPRATAPDDYECIAPCAAAALYRREIFEQLGGFDERFFCYGEDVDLGHRLRLAGGRAVQVKDAVVLHEGSGLTGRHSEFSIYHGHRNRIWLYYKNMPRPLYWLTAPLRLAADITLFVKALAGGYGGAYMRALRDGYGGLGQFKAERNSAKGDSAGMFVWSPIKVLRRQGRIKPIEHGDRDSKRNGEAS